MKVFLFFVFFSVAWSTESTPAPTQAEQKEADHKRWMFAVEEILSSISMGPLRPHFTPDYIAKRTPESVLQSQTSRLRAKTGRVVMDAVGTRAVSCIDPSTTKDEAVKNVLAEFKALGFDILWSKSEDGCFGGQGLVVNGPPPTAPAAKE